MYNNNVVCTPGRMEINPRFKGPGSRDGLDFCCHAGYRPRHKWGSRQVFNFFRCSFFMKRILLYFFSNPSPLYTLSYRRIFGKISLASYCSGQQAWLNVFNYTTPALLALSTIYLSYPWSRIHERTISLKFLGIILRVFRFKVSVYMFTLQTSF